ncbi:MAG: hypothetical protein ACK4GR_04315, partial [bacterium]
MIALLISLSKVPPKFTNPNYFKPVLILIFNKFSLSENITRNQKQIWDFILNENKKKGFVLKSIKQKKISIIDTKRLNSLIIFFLSVGQQFFKVDSLSIKNFEKLEILSVLLKAEIFTRLLFISFKLKKYFNLLVNKPNYDKISYEVLKKNIQYCINSRKFIDNLIFYSFDKHKTVEIDDAISFRRIDEGYEIFVAVADLSEIWNIHMDKFVFEFPQSLYTLDGK